MSDPCDFTIHQVRTIGDGTVVRIEARDGPKLLALIELAPADFMTALLDQGTVTAAIERVKS